MSSRARRRRGTAEAAQCRRDTTTVARRTSGLARGSTSSPRADVNQHRARPEPVEGRAVWLVVRPAHHERMSINTALVLSLSKDERSGSWFDQLTTSGCQSTHALVLSLSKDERSGSWFDQLTTSGCQSTHALVLSLSKASAERVLRRRGTAEAAPYVLWPR